MRKTIKKLLAGLLIAAFVATSASGACCPAGTVYAATVEEYDRLQTMFPVGTVLGSDMFSGVKMSFDGKKIFTVTDKTSLFEVSVTVLDEKLAAKSIPVIKYLFGPANIQLKTGSVSKFKVRIIPVNKEDYGALVTKLGNARLSGIVTRLFDDKASKEQKEALFTELAIALTAEREAQQKADAWAAWIETLRQASAENENTSDSSQQSSESEDPEPAPEPEDDGRFERVIMLFLDMCDLETNSHYGTKNILDLLTARIPYNVKVIISTGGTSDWHMEEYNAYKKYSLKYFYPGQEESDLDKDQIAYAERYAREWFERYKVDLGTTTNIYEVENVDGYNKMVYKRTVNKYMLDKTYLTDFINYGTAHFEAKRFDLIMCDHGGGITGFGVDEIYNKESGKEKDPNISLNIANLKEAISNSDYVKDGNRLDFIGFDACQMSEAEVALALKDYADYLIMSEENEPGEGWDYNAFMEGLYKNSRKGTSSLGRQIVNEYIKQYVQNKDMNVTLGVVDTAKLDAVYEALSDFAQELSKEALKSTDNYNAIMFTIGKNSDYATKTGVYSSGILDLVKLCKTFADKKNGFSKDLRDASNRLIRASKDAMIISKGTMREYGNNGLSINYPVVPFSKVESGKNDKGDKLYYFDYPAEVILKEYIKGDVNPEYRKTYAKLALNYWIAANVLGENWAYINDKGKDYSEQDLVNDLLDKDDIYHTKTILEAAGITAKELKNPESEIRETISELYRQRVYYKNIEIKKSSEGSEADDGSEVNEGSEVETANTATVTVKNINPTVIDTNIAVKASINPDPKKNPQKEMDLGRSLAYSGPAAYTMTDQTIGTATWNVNAYDCKWYTLGNQISSFYMTSINNETGDYSGFIPLARWNDKKDVKGADGKTRDEYMIEKGKDGNALQAIRLNVDYKAKDEKFSYTGFDEVADGGNISSADRPLKDLYGYYLELLSGAAEYMMGGFSGGAVYSVGTVYAQEDTDKKALGLDLSLQTVEDLINAYTINDAYGNAYYMDSDMLHIEKGEGLENYRVAPESYDTSFAKSQALAKDVRDQAAAEVAKEAAEKVEGGKEEITIAENAIKDAEDVIDAAETDVKDAKEPAAVAKEIPEEAADGAEGITKEAETAVQTTEETADTAEEATEGTKEATDETTAAEAAEVDVNDVEETAEAAEATEKTETSVHDAEDVADAADEETEVEAKESAVITEDDAA